MRVFVAGASGVIGRRLVPLLVEAGHEVSGMTRTARNLDVLRALGAHPVLCDVYDADAVCEAVVVFRPDVVIHQLTDLPDKRSDITDFHIANSRMRREGTRNLLAAASVAEASQFIAQSVAWQLPGDAGEAVSDLEQAVLGAAGVVVRYGRFYGPGTFYERNPPAPPRIRVKDAALKTVPALTAPSGIYVLEDNEQS